MDEAAEVEAAVELAESTIVEVPVDSVDVVLELATGAGDGARLARSSAQFVGAVSTKYTSKNASSVIQNSAAPP